MDMNSNPRVIEDLSNCKTNVVEKNIQNYLNNFWRQKKKFILCNEIQIIVKLILLQ